MVEERAPGEIAAPPDEVSDPTGEDLRRVLCCDFFQEAPTMFQSFSLWFVTFYFFLISVLVVGTADISADVEAAKFAAAWVSRRARVQSRQGCGPISWLNQPAWQLRAC